MRIVLFLTLVCIVSGCTSYVSLTRKMVQENEFTNDEMVRIQYYNSESIYLERKATGERTVVDGKLIGQGRVVDQVVIECRTPGVVERIEEDPPQMGNKGTLLWVSFERGTSMPFMGYGDGLFAIYAPEGSIKLGDQTYVVKNKIDGEVERPHLLVESDALEAIKNRRVLPGRRLGE